jgi:hypothetical protein
MDDGAEMKVEKRAKRHGENFLVSLPSSEKSNKPKSKHEQGGSKPNGKCDLKNEFHGVNLLSFSIYMILYFLLEVKLNVC